MKCARNLTEPDRYIKVDLNGLLDWEEENLSKCLAKPTLERPTIEVVQQ